mgnify:CR=1 FL=1
MIYYITVVNNFDILNSTLLQSPYIIKDNVIIMDNTSDNKPISVVYNSAIELLKNKGLNLISTEQQSQQSTWIVFCHQDFYFGENLTERLKLVDKDCIYGPIGAKLHSKKLLGKIK